MKKLIVVQHGEYDKDKLLSDSGKERMRLLAEKLKSELEGSAPSILSSPADRAVESATILALALESSFDTAKELYVSSSGLSVMDAELEALGNLVALHASKTDILILVTHIQFAEDFPAYYGERFLGQKFHPWAIRWSEAKLIDCENKTISHIQ